MKRNKTGEKDTVPIKKSTSQKSHLSLTQTKKTRLTASSPALFVCLQVVFKSFGSVRGIYSYYLIVGNILMCIMRVKCPLFCSEFP